MPSNSHRPNAPRVAISWVLLFIGCTVTSTLATEGKRRDEHDAGDPGDASAASFPREEFLSGSRLERTFLEGEDGLRVFLGFWDKELATQCTFDGIEEEAAFPTEGDARCLPAAQGDIVYSDAKCQHEEVQLVVPQPLAQSDPPLVTLRTQGSCGSRPRVVRVGLQHKIQVYSYDGLGRCVASSDSVVVYPVERTLEPKELVGVVGELHVGRGPLQARYLRLEDHSLARAGFFDTDRATPCSGGYDASGVLHCFPARQLESGAFWVPDNPLDILYAVVCGTGQAATTVQCAARYPLMVDYGPVNDSCSHPLTLYRVQGRVAPKQVRCAGEPAEQPIFEIEEVPSPSLPLLELTRVGGKRLLDAVHSAPGLPAAMRPIQGRSHEFSLQTLVLREFYDAQLDAYCMAAPDTHGILRCLPVDEGFPDEGDGFADAECMKPVIGTWSRGDCNQGAAPNTYVIRYWRVLDPSSPNQGEPRWLIYRAIRPVAPGTARYRKVGATCVQDGSFDAMLQVSFVEEVPPSVFVRLNEVRR